MVFTLASVILAPIAGIISDKFGRYKLMKIGFLLEICSLLILYITTNGIFIVIARILNAMSYNAVAISALARINDTVENSTKRSRINGIFYSYLSIAATVSPLVGGYIADKFGYHSLFLIAGFFAIMVFSFLGIYDKIIHKSKDLVRQKNRKIELNLFRNITEFIHIKELRGIIILGSAVNFAIPFALIVAPFMVLKKLGLNNSYLGYIIFVMGFGTIFQFIFGRLSDKIGHGRGALIGGIGLGISYAGLFFISNFIQMIIIALILAFCTALWNISAIAFISDIGEKKQIEGKIMGEYSSFIRLSQSISFIATGSLLMLIGDGVLIVYSLVILMGLLISKKEISKAINYRIAIE